MSNIFMYILSFIFTSNWWNRDPDYRHEILRSVDEYLHDLSKEVLQVRSYRSLLGNADMLYWIIAEEPSIFASIRFRLHEIFRGNIYTAFTSLSLYEDSPYIHQEEYNKSASSYIDKYLNMEPLKYLVAYPMKKSPEWYLIPYSDRKNIMAEHIKMARSLSSPDNIRSYTTYSYGVGEHEFMVIYEISDLAKWINITWKLREVRARKWVIKEEPILVAELIKKY